MENQTYIFLIFILNGFLIGLLFDIFRIHRKSFKTSNFITTLQDILFWILAGIITLYSILKFNNGEIRGYLFVGISIGVIIYLFLFSKIFITINVLIIKVIKKIFYYILILPTKKIFKFLKKLLLKPILFVFINFRKILSKFININKKNNKKHKKIKYKKDLA